MDRHHWSRYCAGVPVPRGNLCASHFDGRHRYRSDRPLVGQRCLGVPLMGDRFSDRLDIGGRDVIDGQRAAGRSFYALQKYRSAL